MKEPRIRRDLMELKSYVIEFPTNIPGPQRRVILHGVNVPELLRMIDIVYKGPDYKLTELTHSAGA